MARNSRCSSCNGTGRSWLDDRKCKICDGTGRILAMIGDDGSAVPTQVPDVHTGSSVTVCSHCHKPMTSGVFYDSQPFHTDCHNSHVLQKAGLTERCIDCGGSGTYTKEVYRESPIGSFAGSYEHSTVSCTTCQGRGFTKHLTPEETDRAHYSRLHRKYGR